MPEGRRWSTDNPSPAMKSFAEYIRGKEGADFVTDAQVASTFIHHRDWQKGHALELDQERAANKEKREAEAARRKQEREEKAAKKEADKKAKEAAKAAKEAEVGADGDDSSVDSDEPAKSRRRLRTKDEPQVEEPVAAGVSQATF